MVWSSADLSARPVVCFVGGEHQSHFVEHVEKGGGHPVVAAFITLFGVKRERERERNNSGSGSSQSPLGSCSCSSSEGK